ncbi:MAG TPA: type II toxin-antitoxin system RelE/ParE family toxin [Piscirickettsiaceae bacterium]|nr:type II toxin-antitoxin system RelE/ParE family toxin [Piscirickettsiaceae bacterium]HIQ40934.1 type II toxin-antitoxin system RelE/ParE family toxin [Sulfurivirga caldicuralii]
MRVEWTTRSLKQMKKLKDQQIIRRLYQKGETLKNFPNVPGVKALINHPYPYRLRVGDYRLFFSIKDDKLEIIQIEEVKKRDERTY